MMSVRKRALLPSQHENTEREAIRDLVPEDSFHFAKIKTIDGEDYIVIFVSVFAFDDLKQWRESRIGKEMLWRLEQAEYNDYIKCIYFDMIMARPPGEEEESEITFWTEACVNFAFGLNDKEDITLFLFCMECCTLTTIQKRLPDLPLYNLDTRECEDCIHQE